MVTDFGDSLFHILDGHAGKENTGIFNLDAIIEESDAGGGVALGVVSMNQGVYNHLAQNTKYKTKGSSFLTDSIAFLI